MAFATWRRKNTGGPPADALPTWKAATPPPTATATATGEISGYDGLCLVNQNVPPVTASPVPLGNQTLYVTFTTSTGGNFVNVNWFQFT